MLAGLGHVVAGVYTNLEFQLVVSRDHWQAVPAARGQLHRHLQLLPRPGGGPNNKSMSATQVAAMLPQKRDQTDKEPIRYNLTAELVNSGPSFATLSSTGPQFNTV